MRAENVKIFYVNNYVNTTCFLIYLYKLVSSMTKSSDKQHIPIKNQFFGSYFPATFIPSHKSESRKTGSETCLLSVNTFRNEMSQTKSFL